MLLPDILGFQTLLLLSFLTICLVIRQKLRNAGANKEEVARLVVMASDDTAMAGLDYCPSPVPRPYYCAVCYCPTTTRCSQCKAVRYCSGKCQILHWRQGHKDECHPPITTIQFDAGSNLGRQGRMVTNDDGEAKPSVDAKAAHTCIASSDASLLPRGNGLCDDLYCSSEVLKSSTSGKSEKTVSESHISDRGGINASVNKMEQSKPASVESTNSVNSVDSSCRTNKLNKATSSYSNEEVNLGAKFSKGKKATPNNIQTTKLGDGKPLREHGRSRSSSFGASGNHSSSTTRGHTVSSSNSAKVDSCQALPTKMDSTPVLQHTARDSLKASVHKVVQQFKSSKQLKPHPLGLADGIDRRIECKSLFPYEVFMKLYSCDNVELYPFGLINCGNSCYANAVLQCLAFTRPLTSYLLQGLHSKACRKKGWCFLCEFECLLLQAREGNSPLSPIRILSKLEKIGGHLGQGREEDAHEFLRYAVDTMQSSCLKEAGVVGSFAEETTLIGLTFGGYLRSKIKCMRCLGKSERYEQMMDLTVEIGGEISTLEDALAQFTATERLDGVNKYHCSRCKSYEKAKKKLTILETPNILTIVLKRFQSNNFEKLNKSVRYPEVLNMAPYMSGTSDKYPVYSLYAVIVHLDTMNATFSGHYVCYVKNLHGEWFKINDSIVTPVELDRVLLEGAYMLLYARHSPRPRAPDLIRNGAVPHGIKPRKRSPEAIPSTVTPPKNRPDHRASSADLPTTQQKLGKYPPRMSLDNPPFNPIDWRFHSVQRIPRVDSSSNSSSPFSCSDASSCSTTSTKDSSGTEDFSDYLFGEAEASWYRHYGVASNSAQSASYRYSIPELENVWRECSSREEGEFLYGNSGRDYRKLGTMYDGNRSREVDLVSSRRVSMG